MGPGQCGLWKEKNKKRLNAGKNPKDPLSHPNTQTQSLSRRSCVTKCVHCTRSPLWGDKGKGVEVQTASPVSGALRVAVGARRRRRWWLIVSSEQGGRVCGLSTACRIFTCQEQHFQESVWISWYAAPASSSHTLISPFVCHHLDPSEMNERILLSVSVDHHRKTTKKMSHLTFKWL